MKTMPGIYVYGSRHRGKGVNAVIIEALKEWCRSQNITELRLDVYNDNPSAIRAYEKQALKNT
jgi:GNAT superfamily N-acetyltransferase